MDNICLGIDFGTTNSCLSIFYNNQTIIVEDIDGSKIIPTVIELNNSNKIIGKEAYIRQDISNENTFIIYEIKRLIGKKFSELDKSIVEILSYEITTNDEDDILIYNSNNKKYYSVDEILIHIFLSFKCRAELFISTKLNNDEHMEINNAVITVPSYFNIIQREIIKNCATNAGFNVKRILNEPTAGAIAYGLGTVITKENGLNVIIYDFGGGTLDVSLMNINDGMYEVYGSCGNNNLGGSDFDKKIMEYCIQEFINENKINYNEFIKNVEENILHKLKYACEQAKITLSDNLITKIMIKNFYQNKYLFVNLSRQQLIEICNSLIQICIKPLNDILELCEINKNDIDEIIMVGAMTKMPIIRFCVETFYGKNVNCSIDPNKVVSIGASIHGYMILNHTNIQNKLLLIDRTSLSIGLETSGGIMDILIPRGSIIPIKKYKKYTTDTDYMDTINIKIYEGERNFTKDNILIGNFTLNGIEKEKRGLPKIQIIFEVSTDGIIKIYAEDLNNPLNKNSIQIKNNQHELSQEKIDKIINDAKIMDNNDRIECSKKKHYLSLIDSSKRIIENLKLPNVSIDEEDKINIENKINDILNWLIITNYNDITIDKYVELQKMYSTNYSVLLIYSTEPIINLQNSDEVKEKTDCVDIVDDNVYSEQHEYFKNIINEYKNIKKQITIYNNNIVNGDENKNLNELQILFDDLIKYADEKVLLFYINDSLTDDIVKTITSTLYNYDLKFKEKYELMYDELNMVDVLKQQIEELENKILQIYDNSDNETKNNYDLILEKLIEFNTYIYSVENNYEIINYDNINTIKQFINDMNVIIL
jgi:heat shock protein 5